MSHYKDAQNKLYFLDAADAEAQHLSHYEPGPTDADGNATQTPVYIDGAAKWLPADCVPISDAEAEALRAPPPETPEQAAARLERALTEHIDAAARARNWRNIDSARAAAGYPNPWQAEGLVWAQWHTDCWSTSITIQAAVLAGGRPIPSEVELLAEMPAIPIFQ